MTDHEMDDLPDDDERDGGLDPTDGSDAGTLDPETEALLEAVLADRAALADGAALPDMDALVRRGPSAHRRFSPIGIVAIAACAVLVVGTVAGVTLRRSDDVELHAASPAELLEALREPDGPQSFAYESSSSARVGSTGGECSARTTSAGQVDLRNGLAAVHVDGGEVITDRAGNGSITTDLLPPAWGVETPLVRFTLVEAVRAQFAVGAGSPLPGGSSGPVGIAGVGGDIRERFDEIRAAATAVEVVGPDTVRGAETTHIVVTLDEDALASARARANPEGLQAMVAVGLLSPQEAALMSGPVGAPTGIDLTDEDLRVEAWIDDEGQIRRLVSTTTLRSADGSPPGTVPAEPRSTTAYTTTIETFDHDEVQISLPAAGPEATDLGSLPAEVLRPLRDPPTPCGSAPVESIRECTEAAFDEAAAGRIVDDLVAEIPTTFQALITPNAWFGACAMGMGAAPVPTGEDLDMLLRLAKIDPAAADRIVAAAAGVPSLASAPRDLLLYQAFTGCNIVARAGGIETFIGSYDPRMIEGGLSKDAYRDLLTLVADPAVTGCTSR